MARGPAFLYVLPCAPEDLLKLGMSLDPLTRMQAMHPRFYEFFDLARAFAIETETVADARRLETLHARQLREHRAPAPLTVSDAAGGHTEWYRGAYATLRGAAQLLEHRGHTMHAPLTEWLKPRMLARTASLFAWSSLLDVVELEARGGDAVATLNQRRVRDALDAFTAFEIDLSDHVPRAVLDWHAAATAR
jgi:hypothetical protein